MGKSRLVNGLIVPPTHLELIVVDHCNIACRSCNHASPIMPSWFADPDSVHRDFSILAKYYRPARVKVLGGEPLMHKNLRAVIAAARASGISDHFSLTTNGALLHKASDALWECIDEVEISLYPNVAGARDNIDLARVKARDFGKKLTLYQYEAFRGTFSLKGTEDSALIGKIYAACKIAHVWGCHAAREGYFYKCPQSIYTALLTGKSAPTDRIPIVDGASFQAELLDFVNSPIPLSACAHCVGTVGIQEAHELVPRAQWRTQIDKTSEELVDFDWLERSLITQDEFDDCKIPARLKPPKILSRFPWLQGLLAPLSPSSNTAECLRRGKRRARQSAEEARRERGQGGGKLIGVKSDCLVKTGHTARK